MIIIIIIIAEPKSEEAAQHRARKISDLGLNPNPVFSPCVAFAGTCLSVRKAELASCPGPS